MEDLTLTPEEEQSLEADRNPDYLGFYCAQCGRCEEQCPGDVDIPSLMRGYMYAYGYRQPSAAKDILRQKDISSIPCRDCLSCRVSCTMGFDVKGRALDIMRLNDIPDVFLA
jgi:predicted aldo/keto reductase-like oxidoreductase